MTSRRVPPIISPARTIELVLDDIELVGDWSREAPYSRGPGATRIRQRSFVVRRSPSNFPPGISDGDLGRLVDECTEELCRGSGDAYSAYVY